MPQLDRLLPHIAARGSVALLMEPNAQPVLLDAQERATPLLPTPVPATMVELLAKEVMTPEALTAWQGGGEPMFDYPLGDTIYRIKITRGAEGASLKARPVPNHPESEPEPEPTPSRFAPPAEYDPSPRPAAGNEAPMQVEAEVGNHPLAEALFTALLEHRGSDLHCTSYETPSARISGDLEELHDFGILGPNQLMELMEAVAPKPSWERFKSCHDADFAYPFDKGGCRLRVNYFMDRQGPGLVARVIPNEIPDPDKLGLPDPIRRLADLSKGLVLVTGPTGSGKSTTPAANVDLGNDTRTESNPPIREPNEFVHPRKKCLINQREVGTHTESFKSGLRAALREDPDVVLVGEMRDLETIAIALETAITGHLVFGTLHTNSAIGTVDRIVDQFPSDRQQQIRVMLADALKCCISQCLLKKIGGGRVAALESLFITPAIANLIREGKNFQIPSAMQTGRAYGQKLMNDALIELIKSGQVEVMEAYMKCPDKESFIQAAKRVGINCDPRGIEVGS